MAIVMQMHWREMTKKQYAQARKLLDLERNAPAGAKFHVAWFATDGLHVLDVWETRRDFERFQKASLGPVAQQIGIKGRPKVTFDKALAIFAPNV